MVVRVHLHTRLRRRTARGVVRELTVDLDPGARVADLLASLDLADQRGLMLVVNGRTGKLSQELEDGDEVHLIPALSGG